MSTFTAKLTYMAKIYVASSWRNPYQPEVVKKLRELGHQVFDFRNPPDGKGGFFWKDVLLPYWPQLRHCLFIRASTQAYLEKRLGADFYKVPRATAVRILSVVRESILWILKLFSE